MKTNGDESAFPEVHEQPQFNSRTYGLTKREYFAAMAMQGMFTNELLSSPEENANVAKDAVNAADALIDALNDESEIVANGRADVEQILGEKF